VPSETGINTQEKLEGSGAGRRPVSPLLKTSLLFATLMLVLHAVLWLAVPVWRESDPLRGYTTRCYVPR